jgi:hypothetical protein
VSKIEEVMEHQLLQLKLGFAAHLDAREWDRLGALHAEDAIYSYPEALGGEWRGRHAIVDNIIRLNEGGETYAALHIVTNPWISIESQTHARGRWYLGDFLTKQRSDFPSLGGHANPLALLGIYHDEYKKIQVCGGSGGYASSSYGLSALEIRGASS